MTSSPCFQTPVTFHFLGNVLPLRSFLKCCCQDFWSYFEPFKDCDLTTSRSGFSMIPKMMNITLLLLQAFFFFFQLRKINFLPSWCKCSLSHLPWLGSCNGVNYIKGFTLIWRRLPRDTFSDTGKKAQAGSRIHSDVKTQI